MIKEYRCKSSDNTTMGNPDAIKDKGFDKHPENINRAGRPKESAAFKKLRKCTQLELMESYWKVSDMTVGEAREFAKNGNSKLIEWALVKRMLNADIDIIMNRLMGMPKQPFEDLGKLSKLPKEDLIKLAKEFDDECKKGGVD